MFTCNHKGEPLHASRRDQRLVGALVDGLNQLRGTFYRVRDWADEVNRNFPAVEALAEDSNGKTLALEHTLAQPFRGEQEDSFAFGKVFMPLERESKYRVPGWSIDLLVPVAAIPKREFDATGARVTAWFESERHSFPHGISTQAVPGLAADILVVKQADEDSRVYVTRTEPEYNYDEIVKKALSDKLPKLCRTVADTRVLLLEKGTALRSPVETAFVIDRVAREFPLLKKVEEIWMVNTISCETEGWLFFYQIWPNGVTVKFKISLTRDGSDMRAR